MLSPELPAPVLFHPLKHHLGYLREYAQQATEATPAALRADLLTLGNSQFDLYTGKLTPLQLATEVIQYLQHRELLAPAAYHDFISATGADYRTISLSDATDWVLRWGVVPGRHVHLHPARYAANTMRVKANNLKTAMAMVIAAERFQLVIADLPLLNQLRQEWLGLPPVKQLPQEAATGMAKLLQLLQNQEPGT